MNIRKPIIYIGMILLLFVVLDMGFHWKSSSGDVMMETIKVQDSTGEFVTIPKHPKRVVFLNTANLEMYCAVGGREAVVGIPTTSIMSEELRQQVQGVEEVGIVHEPNIEKIISLQPDLVIGINVPMHNRVKEVLKENHIPFYINGLQSIEDTDRTVELYGRLTGDENEADALRKKIKEECDKALHHSRNKTAPRALILFASPNSQNMATGESFAGDIMKRLGGINIADVDSMWTKIPVKKLAQEEAQKLKDLEKVLHARVVGQEEAVVAVAKAIRRGRVGLKDPKRPIGSFLFLGPTGVGKTELCKALSECMFGTENALIRVDMSEYMERHSVSKIVGSPPGYVGYDEGGQLSEKVRRNPYSVILFDEIEKAHPDVFNILLQVLDDGHITDAQGRRIDFKNTIIIMTSNAGAERIVAPKLLGFTSVSDEASDHKKMKEGVLEELRRLFKPEFLNRIDETIVFHQLTKENMHEILEILLKDINKRITEQMGMRLELSEKAKDFLIDKGYDKKYGARPLKRTLQNYLEDKLAESILDGKIKNKDAVFADIAEKDGEKSIVFTPRSEEDLKDKTEKEKTEALHS